MAQSQTRLHLLCYDIHDPRRLVRVHRVAKRHAVPVQYSVFLLEANAQGVATVLREVRHEIDPHEDDVRVYTLPSQPEPLTLGRRSLPDGVLLLDPAMIDRLFQGDSHRPILDSRSS